MNSNSDTAAGGPEPPAEQTQLAGTLRAHLFFSGMDPAHVAVFTDYATATQFAAGQTIFKEGDPANCFYLILNGRVGLEANFEHGLTQPIEEIGAGEVLGWSWMFAPFRWHFGARALEQTSLIFIYGSWLLERCEQDPELGFELMKRVSGVMMHRLQRTRQRLGQAIRAPAS